MSYMPLKPNGEEFKQIKVFNLNTRNLSQLTGFCDIMS